MADIIYYEFKCIHCSSENVNAATNDGGSVQYCNDCKKTYRAKKIAAPPIIIGPDMIRPVATGLYKHNPKKV